MIVLDAGGETIETTAATAAARRLRKPQRLWWHVHQWVGLKLSILLSFVLLTGTLAVFSFDIDWLLHPQMRVDPATVPAGPADWAAIARGVHAYAPDASILRIDTLAAHGSPRAPLSSRPMDRWPTSSLIPPPAP